MAQYQPHRKPETDPRHSVARKPNAPSLDEARGPAAPGTPCQQALRLADAEPRALSPSQVLALQRTVGNRALSSLIQPKLAVNAAGDRHEQEADRVAAHVMRRLGSIETPALQRAPEEEEEVQAKPWLQRAPEEEEEIQTKPLLQRASAEEEEVQTKPAVQRAAEEDEGIQTRQAVQRQPGDSGGVASPGLENAIRRERGGGSALPEWVRQPMEQAFAADFEGVRVHTDQTADNLSQAVQARAFTTGQDLFFRSGQYDPASSSGKELLAHELAHTLQQGATQRIAGWAPKGHRLTSELAFTEGGLDQFYSKRARDYLIGRSPDVDFKTDGLMTMLTGRKASAQQLKRYEQLLATGKEEDRQAAISMYNNNDLHVREGSYMDQHGEAGHYKQEGSAANEAIVKREVDKAIGQYHADPAGALSTLSDALHMAEDRGSHGEGSPFAGHDVRLGLHSHPWEKEHYAGAKWDPDNASENTTGAVLAVGYAQGVLSKFKNGVKPPKGMKITLGFWADKFSRKRRLFGLVKSSNPLTKLSGHTGVDMKKLQQLVAAARADPALRAQYERAKKEPGGVGRFILSIGQGLSEEGQAELRAALEKRRRK